VTSRKPARKRSKSQRLTKRRRKVGRVRAQRRGSPTAGGTRPRGVPLRWNPDADDVQRSVVQLVLTLVELVRKLMERQAIRRMEQRTLSRAETEAVGAALMEIERTIRDIGRTFDLAPEDLNLDLGSIKLL
jgi:gas vesicle protein GvpK